MTNAYDLSTFGWVVSIVCIIIGIIWSRKEFKDSHANFYYNISLKVRKMVKRIKDSTRDRDTDQLIEIFFYSLEEHLLYILQHHKFTQKRVLSDKDFARYNNMFYAQMSGIYMEWVVNSIDDRLLSIFLEHEKVAIKTHMSHMKEILGSGVSVKQRRYWMANEFIEFLAAIEANYDSAYKQYQEVLTGEIDYKKLMSVIRIREEDIGNIFENLVKTMNIAQEATEKAEE